jgi:uncharacterized membrane protein
MEEAAVSAYGWLKVLHVLSVIVWLGGTTALAIVTWRVARERDRAALTSLLRQWTTFGKGIVGPASGLVLLSGLTMVGLARIGFGTMWVVWGYLGIALHGFIGGAFLSRRVAELSRIAAEPSADDSALIGAGRRLWTMQLIYVLVLATVVAAMVLKPTP